MRFNSNYNNNLIKKKKNLKKKTVKKLIIFFTIIALMGLGYFVSFYKNVPISWVRDKIETMSDNSINIDIEYIDSFDKFNIYRIETRNDYILGEEKFYTKTKYNLIKTGTKNTMNIEYIVTYYEPDDIIRQEVVTKYYIKDGKYTIETETKTQSVTDVVWKNNVISAFKNCIPVNDNGTLKGHEFFKTNLNKVTQQYFHITAYAKSDRADYAYYYKPLTKQITTVRINSMVFHNGTLSEIIHNEYSINLNLFK